MAYFDKKRHSVVAFNEIKTHYNISTPPAVKRINKDIADLIGLYQVVQQDLPDYDPDDYNIEVDYTQDPTYDEDRMEVSWPWKLIEKWNDELDEEGNIVRTAEQVKAAFFAEQAEAEANAPTEEEIAEQERLNLFESELESSRLSRNDELLRTDIYVSIPDYPLEDGVTVDDWKTYRESLRTAFDALDSTVDTFEDVRATLEGVLESAPDYVAPEEPAE